MSTNNLTPAKHRTNVLLGISCGLVVMVTIWLLFRDRLPGNMATGILVGGLTVVVIFAFASWRSARNPYGVTSFERTVAAAGDERDKSVQEKTFALMGVCSVPVMSAAGIALALDAPVEVIVGIMMWSQILIGVVSFVVINKKS